MANHRNKTMAFAVDERLWREVRKQAFAAELTPSGYLYRLVKQGIRRRVKVNKGGENR